MKVIYEFSDGVKSEVEVTGELAAEYCVLAGVDPAEPPQMLEMLEVEKKVDRKHNRPDHKYLGQRLSIEDADPDGVWLSDGRDILSEVVVGVDKARAMSHPTERQRWLLKMVEEGYNYTEIANIEDVDESAVRRAVERARKTFKKFYN